MFGVFFTGFFCVFFCLSFFVRVSCFDFSFWVFYPGQQFWSNERLNFFVFREPGNNSRQPHRL